MMYIVALSSLVNKNTDRGWNLVSKSEINSNIVLGIYKL
jgi:hypothetical protein